MLPSKLQTSFSDHITTPPIPVATLLAPFRSEGFTGLRCPKPAKMSETITWESNGGCGTTTLGHWLSNVYKDYIVTTWRSCRQGSLLWFVRGRPAMG